ncbi:hypothetical protein SAICODRAFT_28866, partial [Saitoella complicata NRRL Y-17804]|uniref:uncharacterized protein n=1 Tax=Saitoella complicata (strain BCRC 22490 / CBS 7301 / JCM 7358 / NBRC 10748 / NRRL Y-17804) TaxID=698492 RepID=UPI000866C467
MEEQHQEILGKVAKEKISAASSLTAPFFADVKYKVSAFALSMIDQQYILARRGLATEFRLPTCRDYMKRAFGLPCAHGIIEALEGDRVLPINDIHGHWHLVLDENYIGGPATPETNQQVRDAQVFNARGRPRGSQNRRPAIPQSST